MREHHQEGYWPREKLIAMNEAALKALMREHPNRAPTWLRPRPFKEKYEPPTIDVPVDRWMRRDLIHLVAREFQVTLLDILSMRRTRDVAFARMSAMFLCKRFTLSSYPEIARSFGGKDHTTVLHAVRKIERIVAEQNMAGGDNPRKWARALAKIMPQIVAGTIR